MPPCLSVFALRVFTHHPSLLCVLFMPPDDTAAGHGGGASSREQDAIARSRDRGGQHFRNRSLALEPDDDVTTKAHSHVALFEKIVWLLVSSCGQLL